MVDERVKKAAVLTAVFTLLSLGVMFYRAATKNIIIAEATKTEGQETVAGTVSELAISSPTSEKGRGSLVIPLEAGVDSDDVTFEEKHAEHEFLLYINGKTPDFYLNNSTISDLDIIKDAQCIQLDDAGSVCLSFKLDALYENETSLGDKEIIVTFKTPGELFERIVVVDPVDDTGLLLAGYIKKQMDADENIRVFYTRQTDGETSDDAAFALMEDAAADFYVQVGADPLGDAGTGIKTYYNGRFFIRSFGNVELADKLERNTAVMSGSAALGLFEAGNDNERLMNSRIPSAFVAVGAEADADGEEVPPDEGYLESCAEGIVNGIREAFAVTDPSGEPQEEDPIQGIINGN